MALRVDDVDLERDRALVERFQAGDPTAFDELYQRYQHRLLRFCLKRVRHRETAEEIAQEAFTRAFGAMSTFNGERRFYPWVTVIAGRLCVDHYRRAARMQTSSTPEPVCIDDEHDAVVAAVDSELIGRAMSRLRFRHQDVLRLREIEGLSYQQIADQFGVSAGTVDALLFRARKALRREFQAIGGNLTALPAVAVVIRALGRMRNRAVHMVNLSPGATAAAVVGAAAATAALSFSPSPPTAPAPLGRTPTTASHAPLTSRSRMTAPSSIPSSPTSVVRSTELGPAGGGEAPPSGVSPALAPGSPIQGLIGPGGVVNPQPVQNLLPTGGSPGLPTEPTLPGPLGQTVTSIQQQLSGH